jgi:dihydrolipoamide dehydrogenase
MEDDVYDLVVLGGGAAGVPAAVRASQLGGRVALVESGELGGHCMNRGCVPFAHMMVACQTIGAFALAKDMGFEISSFDLNYGALRKRQSELICSMREGVRSLLSKRGINLFRGRGKLAGTGKVMVDGETLHCKKVILATGAKWAPPDFGGAEMNEAITSPDELLQKTTLPKRVLLFGRSPWLVEIAQFLHRAGTRAVLVTPERNILSNESEAISSRLTKTLKNEGLRIFTEGNILELAPKKDGIHLLFKSKNKDEQLVVDQVIAAKRVSSLEGIGLDSIGLDENADYIITNNKMETTKKDIYAAGDLSAPETRRYSHLASAGGIVAAENAMGRSKKLHPRARARILLTQPQVGCVGLTSKEAEEAGYDVIVGSAPLSMNPFGMIIAQKLGLVEIVADSKHGEILGIHILGEGASELIGEAVLAIQMELTLVDLAAAMFPHPTLSESLAEAAREAMGQAIYMMVS